MDPAHVVARPGDSHSLCGVKAPLPVVAAAHVATHRDGWGMEVCAACEAHEPPPQQLQLS